MRRLSVCSTVTQKQEPQKILRTAVVHLCLNQRKTNKKNVQGLLVAVFLAVSANAWWCTGHMTVAYVALRRLQCTQHRESMGCPLCPGPFPQTPDSCRWLAGQTPEVAGSEAMESWHFINQPYDPSNYPIQKWPIQEENVEVLIRQLDETLKKSSAPKWDLNFALGNLVHFYEISTSRCTTELFSSVYPTVTMVATWRASRSTAPPPSCTSFGTRSAGSTVRSSPAR